ncbi:serine carboxypeptidase [Irpex rosettiformis]|uniref:Serine carboxypeptidase n=1 Tax=Irpex rosettiformis TaxID=378272 RepID=A0ACB8TY10_9APHY|nr:serine carboxypeptidase [Irpex rosettiformis]
MRSLKNSVLALLSTTIIAVTASNIRQPSGGFDSAKYDNGLFAPFEDLHALSEREFTTLEHPLFPNYGVRIKESDFCDGTVKSYTGYIDVEARHLFFYFFESRNNPDKDDVILWTDGGPGCSSALGLFMELGPCRVTSPDNSIFNPYSWNEKANVFFIDQPIGVGFSYADYEEYVGTTEDGAKDVAAFIAIFFEHFTKFKGRAFHMASGSYGGRYIPAYASYVYDQNPKLIAAGATPINLTSIMIGNGCSDQITMIPSYYEMQCKSETVPPVVDISTCVAIKRALPRCQEWLKKSCDDITDSISCAAAIAFCTNTIEVPFYATGMNPYDISKPCDGLITETLCYPITNTIASFLDKPDIRRTLGVDSDHFTGRNFSKCSDEVGARFRANLDSVFPSPYYIAALLERGIRTLIYVGANDWICNWIGNQNMLLNLDWTGADAFKASELKEWKVDGEVVGLTRSAGKLTFATIDGAGHLVPLDKPKVSLELVKRWLAAEDL